MLVANPSQATSFALHSKKPCHPSSNNVVASSSTTNGTTTTSSSSSTKNVINNVGNKTTRNVLASNCAGCIKLPPSTAGNTTNATTILKHNITASHNHGNSTTNTTTTTSTTATSSGIRNSGSSGYGITTTTGASNALMKSLSVRLNRGTEFLKETVQKAFIAKIPTHLSSVLNLNLYTVPPTATHRFPAERLNANSTDSLQTEMCHFMPIRTAPTTPWKSNSKSRGGASLKMPKACLAKKVNLNSSSRGRGGMDEDAFAGAERHLQFRPKPNSTLLTTIFTTPERQSAFVCLVAKMKTVASTKSKTTTNAAEVWNLRKTNKTKSRTKPRRSRTKPKSSALNRKSTDTKMLISEQLLPPKRGTSSLSLAYQAFLPQQTEITKTRNSKRNSNNNNKSKWSIAAPKAAAGNVNVIKSNAKISVTKSMTKANVVRGKSAASINKKSKSNSNNNNNNNNSSSSATALSIKNNNNNNNNSSKKNNNVVDSQVGQPSVVKQRRVLKRKPPKSSNEGDADMLDGQGDHARPPLRKSSRLSKDNSSSNELMLITTSHSNSDTRHTKRPTQKREPASRSTTVFTPPLTRSRLKQMLQSKST